MNTKMFARNLATAPMAIRYNRDGSPAIHPLLDKTQRGFIVGFIFAFALTMMVALWAIGELVPWFEARWQPVNKFEAAQEVAPPQDSELHRQLVKWVKSKARRPLTDGFATMVIEETFNQAIQNRVDPFVMLAVMSVESSFDYTARSGAGAIGLTQVIPKWHMDKMPNAAHVFDPKNNIRVGTEVFAEYMRWYKGDVQKALLQYNGSLHMPSSPYSQKVMAAKTQLLMFLEARLL